MDSEQGLVAKGFQFLVRINSAILFLFLIVSFCFGLWGFAPFLDSEIYVWLKSQIQSNALLGSLIDLESMVLDSIISASVPMLLIWAGAFFAYDYFKDKVKEINELTSKLSIFAGGPAKIFLVIYCVTLGVVTYILLKHQVKIALMILAISSLMFLFPGILFRYYAKLNLKKTKLLDLCARPISIFLAVLALLAYGYSIFAEPISLWFTIHDTFRSL